MWAMTRWGGFQTEHALQQLALGKVRLGQIREEPKSLRRGACVEAGGRREGGKKGRGGAEMHGRGGQAGWAMGAAGKARWREVTGGE